MIFDFNEEKNELLFQQRGITFNQVIDAIEETGVLLNFKHPNKEKYPNQMIFVIELNKYTYCVPYIVDKDKIFMKTVYPNRDFLYLIQEKRDEK